VDEFRKAIEKGYKLVEMHEAWHFKVERYNPLGKKVVCLQTILISFSKQKQGLATGLRGSRLMKGNIYL